MREENKIIGICSREENMAVLFERNAKKLDEGEIKYVCFSCNHQVMLYFTFFFFFIWNNKILKFQLLNLEPLIGIIVFLSSVKLMILILAVRLKYNSVG